ncbi:MAG: DUF4920 domain-containing protein [Reichenbachiella sp.]|uniref:DUF4920 domain-containing protein n=1 Tax=Reichenbachiella sp. TaxID=2184521 RepID=UPI0032677EBE
MKNLFLITITVLLATACGKKETVKEQPKEVSYGEAFDPSNVTGIAQLSTLMSESDSVPMTLVADIEKTCAVKGCWMQLKTGDENSLRVTFKDYGFFVPKSGMEGKKAIIQGFCKKQETSIEDLKHFAKDAGESEEYIASITEPKMEYNFEASGVIIQD